MAIDSTSFFSTYLNKTTKAAPLAVFRILFGLIMLISLIRFAYHGWIESLYLTPSFHFHYSGFEFISVPGNYTYLLFGICGLAALLLSVGYKYRIASLLFFISFTYIELLDKTYYLNHYYFISIVAFILIFLPANCTYSVDAYHDDTKRYELVPKWTIDILKLMLAIVYIYAGIAKLNPDWMFRAMPLTIWLPTKFDLPLLGQLMHEKWMHYLFSWGGALYDLSIVFFLMWKPTRIFAFIMVVIFHVLTRVLFPIGMFPYIMIISTFIFFSATFHEKILSALAKGLNFSSSIFKNSRSCNTKILNKVSLPILTVFMLFQILFPLRSFAFPGSVYWTEQGYRFSWRVMLMEKTGYATFKIVDGKTGKRFYVQNDDFLSPIQEKQMSTQADFILEYAKHLGDHFSKQGHQNIEVYVESYAALNGRKNQLFIDPDVNLLNLDYRSLCQSHIIPLND